MATIREICRRASAILLTLIPIAMIASISWLLDIEFVSDGEDVVLALISPMCLLAIWCALGSMTTWLRLAIAVAACAGWAGWIRLLPPASEEISAPYFIGIFGTFALPLFLLRLLGVAIRSFSTWSAASAVGNWYPRFSLWNLFQLLTLGALLMAADQLFGLSRELGLGEVLIGAAISTESAILTWVFLGSGRKWLRFAAWLTIPLVLYFPLEGDWQFGILLWFGLSVLVGGVLFGFRLLGYRLTRGVSQLDSSSVTAEFDALSPAA